MKKAQPLLNQRRLGKAAGVAAGTRKRILDSAERLFAERGFDAARDVIRRLWAAPMAGGAGQRKHPKAALQEWAAGNRRKPPVYTLIAREGPDHAAKFVVRVAVAGVGEAEARGSSKQEAETTAARQFMESFAS